MNPSILSTDEFCKLYKTLALLDYMNFSLYYRVCSTDSVAVIQVASKKEVLKKEYVESTGLGFLDLKSECYFKINIQQVSAELDATLSRSFTFLN